MHAQLLCYDDISSFPTNSQSFSVGVGVGVGGHSKVPP